MPGLPARKILTGTVTKPDTIRSQTNIFVDWQPYNSLKIKPNKIGILNVYNNHVNLSIWKAITANVPTQSSSWLSVL